MMIPHSLPPLVASHDLRHTSPVNVATYNRDGNFLLTGAHDHVIRLWSAEHGTLIREYTAHSHEIRSIAVSPYNDFFTSVGGDHGALYWDACASTLLTRFNGHNGPINTCAYNFDGQMLFTGSADHMVMGWDLRSQQRRPIQVFSDAEDAVSSVVVYASHQVIAGSVDGSVRAYDLRKGLMSDDYFEDPVINVRLLQNPRAMIVSTLNSTMRLMDRSDGRVLETYTGHVAKEFRTQLSLSCDETYLFAGDEQGVLYTWNINSGTALSSFAAHGRHITWAECHPRDPHRLITGSVDGYASVWGPAA